MQEEYHEIDLKELIQSILKKWWLLAILSIIGFSMAFIITKKYITPVYQSSTTLFIGKEENEIGGVPLSLSDLQKYNQLIVDYKQIARTRLVIGEVINNLNINMSGYTFRNSMYIYTIGESRLFAVSFKHTNPHIAAAVANELAKQLTFAVAEIVDVKNIRIIDEALVPQIPISPNISKNVIIAGLLGFMTGVIIVFLQVLMNNTIKKEDDVEKLLGIPVIGIIPKFIKGIGKTKSSNSLATISQPHSYISESYRMFRTNINYLNIDKVNQVLMVTSSIPTEGKTTTISNLAISMAQEEKKILLIEGDLRCPKVHTIFDINQKPGLTNILFEKLILSEVVQKAHGVVGVDILPSGVIPPTPTELLDSDVFKSIIEEARKLYDIILIDVPPVLCLTDARVISQVVDGVILVVAANKTKKVIINNTKKVLDKVGANIIGVVLTKMNLKTSNNYYGGYYNYVKRKKRKKN